MKQVAVRSNSNRVIPVKPLYSGRTHTVLGKCKPGVRHMEVQFFFADQSENANYADDNTPYACAGSIEEVIKKLETDGNLLMTWFYENGQ